MKKIVLIACGCFAWFTANAQAPEVAGIQPTSHQVVVPVSGEFENNDVVLSFTMGETAIGLTSEDNGNNTISLAQGFQHPTIILKTTSILDAYLGQISIYPNPSAEQVFLDFPEETFPSMEYSITDLSGKVLATKEIRSSEQIDIGHFATGVYILSLQSDKGEQIGSFKLQKTE